MSICTAKRIYDNVGDAHRDMQERHRKDPCDKCASGLHVNIYRCPYCWRYHWGHTTANKRTRSRRKWQANVAARQRAALEAPAAPEAPPAL